MKKTITSNEITFDTVPQALADVLSGVNQLISKVGDLERNYAPKEPDVYMTRREVSALLKCDLSTIHNWCRSGRLKPYGIGARVYFRRSEVLASIVPLKNNSK
jgi:excisionase family DNA binding protein